MKQKLKANKLVGNNAFLSRAVLQELVVGSSIMPMQPAAQAAFAAASGAPVLSMPQPRDFTPPAQHSGAPMPPLHRLTGTLRHYGWISFALLLLLIGSGAIEIGGNYYSSRIAASHPARAIQASAPTIAGLNLTVPAKDFQTRLQTITSQPATLTVGDQTVPIGADTIKSWLQITSNKNKSEYYIRIKAGSIAASLRQMSNMFVKAPINQVTATEDGVSRVVVGGRNGTALTNPDTLKTQADEVAKTVMNGKGLKFSTPLAVAPFQSVTPATFDKLLVADITTKKMWAFQNGKQVNSWLVSAGKPSTPTPVGMFHVYAKFSVQDMRGFNPNGTKYFQPHVRWISYFYQGSAVHGVYWHPRWWFGAINSSHGCIGLPEDEAQWIFNWDSIGTTVIVHT